MRAVNTPTSTKTRASGRSKVLEVHNSAGAILVEAAISIAIILFCVTAGVGVLLVSYRVLAASHALNSTARWAALGERLQRDLGAGMQTLSIEGSIKQKLVENAAIWGISLNQNNVRLCPTTIPNCSSDIVVHRGMMVLIRWDLSFRVLVLNINRTLPLRAFTYVEIA